MGTLQTCAGFQRWVKDPVYVCRLQVWGIRELQVWGGSSLKCIWEPQVYAKGRDPG